MTSSLTASSSAPAMSALIRAQLQQGRRIQSGLRPAMGTRRILNRDRTKSELVTPGFYAAGPLMTARSRHGRDGS